MNILFLTLVQINSIENRGIYEDLLRKFRDEGHHVHVVTPVERREKKSTNLIEEHGVSILQVKTLNIQKTNVLEKGLGTLAIEYQYLRAIKKNFKNVKFDLILYSTPPITFTKVINFIKERDNAYSYLLLKDIFPQNAIDMGMLSNGGFLHKFFQKKEHKLYDSSDTIGCMSPANVNYLLKHNSQLSTQKVEENPNSIIPVEINYTPAEKTAIRSKYGLPLDKKILVYGGNLGKPQGLEFLLEVIKNTTKPNYHFLIVGNGTQYDMMQAWFNNHQPNHATLMQRLPKADYDVLLAACDIGLIFLHPDFTIPNFPSRLLSYLEMRIPVIAVTDPNTDIGKVVEKAQCGYGVLSGDLNGFDKCLSKLNDDSNYRKMSRNAWQLLVDDYCVDRSYDLIVDKVNTSNR